VDLPVRKKLPHKVPQGVPAGSWFFITIKCVPMGKNQLCRAGIGDAVLAAMKHNHDSLLWHCRLCLLMPDHLHAILAFPGQPGMETAIRNWKKFVAGKHGMHWQRDFYDHRLRDHHELEEKTHYVLMNPVRKGLCERAEDWIWIFRPNDRPPPSLG
jgi:REP element-mobilizing transposase RayT